MIVKKDKQKKSLSLRKTKKVSVLPTPVEFSDLDRAVSELSKQTEALLGKSGEKMSKPTLPKRASPRGHKSARSFDIIHSADANKKTDSVLKASHPSQKILPSQDEKLLSSGTDEKEVKTPVKPLASDIIKNHTVGALKFTDKSVGDTQIDPVKIDSEADTEKDKQKPGKTDSSNVAGSSIPKGIADSDLPKPDVPQAEDGTSSNTEPSQAEEDSGTSNAQDEISNQENDSSGKSDLDVNQPEQESVEDTKPDTETLPEVEVLESSDPTAPATTDTFKNIQIYSDNLDSDAKDDDSTTDSDKDSDKVDVFDAEQYHGTLHDWSKLEYHNRAPIIILLLLTIVLAAGVYLIVTGASLPFGL